MQSLILCIFFYLLFMEYNLKLIKMHENEENCSILKLQN